MKVLKQNEILIKNWKNFFHNI